MYDIVIMINQHIICKCKITCMRISIKDDQTRIIVHVYAYVHELCMINDECIMGGITNDTK